MIRRLRAAGAVLFIAATGWPLFLLFCLGRALEWVYDLRAFRAYQRALVSAADWIGGPYGRS